MSLLGIFDIGKSAILASQIALDTTANNIANANTPGYSKQDAILSIRSSGSSLGGGVAVSGINRSYDRFLQAQLLFQDRQLGMSGALKDGLGQIESLFNEQNGSGLFDSLNAYFNSWEEVSADPGSTTARNMLMQNAGRLVDDFKGMESRLQQLSDNAAGEIQSTADRINAIASSVADLNEKIAQQEAGGSGQANDLRDQRDQLLSELSGYLDFSSFEDSSGRVTVIAGQRNLVEGASAASVSVNKAFDGTLSFSIDNVDITGRITSGKIEGLLQFRDRTDEYLKNIRKMAAGIFNETNQLHRTGFGLDGSTGLDFFQPLSLSSKDYSAGAGIASMNIADYSALTLDEYEIRFTGPGSYDVYDSDRGTVVSSGAYTSGGTISFDGIDVVISNDAGGPQAGDRLVISPIDSAIQNAGVAVPAALSIAASSSLAGLPGDNQDALSITDLNRRGMAFLNGQNFSDFYSSLVANAGSLSQTAQDSYSFEQSVMNNLQAKRESVSGVSLDEEAVNLMKYQRSFQAGAKLISITDELLQTILQL